MNKTSMTQNKRNQKLGYSPDELRIISKYAGKICLESICDELNKVSRTHRKPHLVRAKMNSMGYSVVVKP